jgi:hypothetical protein
MYFLSYSINSVLPWCQRSHWRLLLRYPVRNSSPVSTALVSDNFTFLQSFTGVSGTAEEFSLVSTAVAKQTVPVSMSMTPVKPSVLYQFRQHWWNNVFAYNFARYSNLSLAQWCLWQWQWFWAYLITNLSGIEPIKYWTYLTPNPSDNEPLWLWTLR